MALDTKDSNGTNAKKSDLDSYGVWVKNPPRNSEGSTPGTSAEQVKPSESSSDETDIFFDDSSDSSFEDVFETIESETTDPLTDSLETQESETIEVDSSLDSILVESESSDETETPATKTNIAENDDFDITFDDSPIDETDETITLDEPQSRAGLGVQQSSPATESILKQISAELLVLRTEITNLKTDLGTLKRTNMTSDFSNEIAAKPQNKTAIVETFAPPEETALDIVTTDENIANEAQTKESGAGFFGDSSDDEIIALSGVELQNILTGSEFPLDSEETGEEFDDMQPGIAAGISDPLDEIPDQFPEFSETNNIFVEDDESSASDTSAEQIAVEQDADGEIDETDPDLELPNIDFEAETLEEPQLDNIEFDVEESEEKTIPEEIIIPKTDDILVESSEESEEPAVEEIEEQLPEEEDIIEEIIDVEISDDEIQITDETMDFLSQDTNSALEEKTSEEESEVDDTPTEEVFGDQWGEATVEDTESETITDNKKGIFDIPKEEVIDGELKAQIKTVLTYMDQLLENLPEEKIEEFARSEYFESYKKLFDELGIS
jgi:hypothetical protein